jgi:hypothetical protein
MKPTMEFMKSIAIIAQLSKYSPNKAETTTATARSQIKGSLN